MYLDPSIFKSATLSVTWSLAVEEQFYLFLPVAIRSLSRTWLTAALFAWVLASPIIRYFMHSVSGLEWIMLFTRGDSLGLGALCAVLVRSEKWPLAKRWAWSYGLAPFVLLPLTFVFIHLRLYLGFLSAFGIKFMLLGLTYGSVLLFVLSQRSRWTSRVLCLVPIQYLGRVSYFLYLTHIGIRECFLLLMPGFWLPTFAALAVTLLLAQVSWQWLERPMIGRGHRLRYVLPVGYEPEVSGR